MNTSVKNPQLSPAAIGKPFWASQTVWSSVAVIGSSTAGALLAWQSGDMGAFGAAVTAVLGGVNAIVGRFRAVRPIG